MVARRNSENVSGAHWSDNFVTEAEPTLYATAPKWYLSTRGVLAVATGVTLVALLENTVAPWSPFFVVYVALAIAIPLKLRTYRFGAITDLRWWQWVLCLLIPLVLQSIVGFLLAVIYPNLLASFGVSDTQAQQALYSFDAMFTAMLKSAGAKWGTSASAFQRIYVGFIVLWAGLGEELFYRGYVHGSLRKHHGFWLATLLSAFFFAIRHYTQMFILWPDFPWAAASVWVIVSFAIGIVMSFLYEKTRSLWMPVIVHYLFNLIPYLAG